MQRDCYEGEFCVSLTFSSLDDAHSDLSQFYFAPPQSHTFSSRLFSADFAAPHGHRSLVPGLRAEAAAQFGRLQTVVT